MQLWGIEGDEIVVFAATLSGDGREIVELGDEVGRVADEVWVRGHVELGVELVN